jgi:hypothetical protein
VTEQELINLYGALKKPPLPPHFSVPILFSGESLRCIPGKKEVEVLGYGVLPTEKTYTSKELAKFDWAAMVRKGDDYLLCLGTGNPFESPLLPQFQGVSVGVPYAKVRVKPH